MSSQVYEYFIVIIPHSFRAFHETYNTLLQTSVLWHKKLHIRNPDFVKFPQKEYFSTDSQTMIVIQETQMTVMGWLFVGEKEINETWHNISTFIEYTTFVFTLFSASSFFIHQNISLFFALSVFSKISNHWVYSICFFTALKGSCRIFFIYLPFFLLGVNIWVNIWFW